MAWPGPGAVVGVLEGAVPGVLVGAVTGVFDGAGRDCTVLVGLGVCEAATTTEVAVAVGTLVGVFVRLFDGVLVARTVVLVGVLVPVGVAGIVGWMCASGC